MTNNDKKNKEGSPEPAVAPTETPAKPTTETGGDPKQTANADTQTGVYAQGEPPAGNLGAGGKNGGIGGAEQPPSKGRGNAGVGTFLAAASILVVILIAYYQSTTFRNSLRDPTPTQILVRELDGLGVGKPIEAKVIDDFEEPIGPKFTCDWRFDGDRSTGKALECREEYVSIPVPAGLFETNTLKKATTLQVIVLEGRGQTGEEIGAPPPKDLEVHNTINVAIDLSPASLVAPGTIVVKAMINAHGAQDVLRANGQWLGPDVQCQWQIKPSLRSPIAQETQPESLNCELHIEVPSDVASGTQEHTIVLSIYPPRIGTNGPEFPQADVTFAIQKLAFFFTATPNPVPLGETVALKVYGVGVPKSMSYACQWEAEGSKTLNDRLKDTSDCSIDVVNDRSLFDDPTVPLSDVVVRARVNNKSASGEDLPGTDAFVDEVSSTITLLNFSGVRIAVSGEPIQALQERNAFVQFEGFVRNTLPPGWTCEFDLGELELVETSDETDAQGVCSVAFRAPNIASLARPLKIKVFLKREDGQEVESASANIWVQPLNANFHVFVVDESQRMAHEWHGTKAIDLAKDAIRDGAHDAWKMNPTWGVYYFGGGEGDSDTRIGCERVGWHFEPAPIPKKDRIREITERVSATDRSASEAPVLNAVGKVVRWFQLAPKKQGQTPKLNLIILTTGGDFCNEQDDIASQLRELEKDFQKIASEFEVTYQQLIESTAPIAIMMVDDVSTLAAESGEGEQEDGERLSSLILYPVTTIEEFNVAINLTTQLSYFDQDYRISICEKISWILEKKGFPRSANRLRRSCDG